MAEYRERLPFQLGRQLESGDARQRRPQYLVEFRPGQGSAQTVVDALAEGERPNTRTLQPEPVGLAPRLRIARGRNVVQMHDVTTAEGDTLVFDGLHALTQTHGDGRFEAQQFLDRVGY